jgi:beta-lactam-binding protein with PASTA domain/predicted Ser/Thr protein kinase
VNISPGTVIGGRYEISGQLGSGGMATVYLARDQMLDREVAVKILDARYASDPAFVERFRREASAAAALSHPNIVAVYDRGETDGTYYIVMEYIPGPDLKEIVRQRAPLPPLEAIDDTLQLLGALTAANRRGIVHRDVKPQNVMVGEDGRLKVTDFGIARAGEQSGMTEAGSVIGTAQYLSPEQARGDEVTERSDVYAAGIVLYELLTGRVPFDGERAVSVAMKQVNEPPVNPSVYAPGIPEELEDVVLVALEKRPDDRFESAEDMAQDLLEVRRQLTGGAPTGMLAAAGAAGAATAATSKLDQATGATQVASTPPPPGNSSVRRRRWIAAIVIVAIVALAGVGAALIFTGGGDDGGETVTVPDVVGLEVEQAISELEAADLSTSTRDIQDDSQAPGRVVDTSPEAGERVDAGSEVVLFVSAEPDSVAVPDVTDRELDDARATLERAGFTVSVERESSEDVDEGVVISQSPRGGADAPQGSEVALVVSSGQDLVAVPDVLNQSQSSAESEIAAAGLSVGAVTTQGDSRAAPGTVLSQSPSPGTEIPEGDAVSLVVAIAEPEVEVPGVIGSDGDSARASIEGAGLIPVSEGASSDEPIGTVISQDPPGGSLVQQGSTVRFTVSVGPTKESDPVDEGGGGGDGGGGGGGGSDPLPAPTNPDPVPLPPP